MYLRISIRDILKDELTYILKVVLKDISKAYSKGSTEGERLLSFEAFVLPVFVLSLHPALSFGDKVLEAAVLRYYAQQLMWIPQGRSAPFHYSVYVA